MCSLLMLALPEAPLNGSKNVTAVLSGQVIPWPDNVMTIAGPDTGRIKDGNITMFPLSIFWNVGTILTVRTTSRRDFAEVEKETDGALDPIVEADIAPSVPRFPDAITELSAFKMPHLMLDRLSWIKFGVLMGDMLKKRGTLEEIP